MLNDAFTRVPRSPQVRDPSTRDSPVRVGRTTEAGHGGVREPGGERCGRRRRRRVRPAAARRGRYFRIRDRISGMNTESTDSATSTTQIVLLTKMTGLPLEMVMA